MEGVAPPMEKTIPRWYVDCSEALADVFLQSSTAVLTLLPGLDLQGNTYWEFRDSLSPGRMRRIVQYPAALPYSEVTSLITPAWHQWLRHTRAAPPSLTEQSQDLVRQRQLKVLAAEADARWNAKESFLDAPRVQQTAPVLGRTDAGARGLPAMAEGRAGGSGVDGSAPGTRGQQSRAKEVRDNTTGKIATLAQDSERMKVQGAPPPRVYTNPGLSKKGRQEKEEPQILKKDDPWQKAKRGGPSGPSEEWQPQAWNPSAAMPRS